jgi:tetratricopeptide (TPR) repeat protein
MIAEAETERRQGRDAKHLWQKIIAIAPEHPRVLFVQGQWEMERRRPDQAAQFFARAGKANRAEAAIPFHEALAHRAAGNAAGEMTALDRALTIDPDYFLALLGKGVLLERQLKPRAAARIYRRLLDIAPQDEKIAPALREAIAHARTVAAQDTDALENWLADQVQGLDISERARECFGIAAGRMKPHVQHAELLHFPQLPAIAFYDRALFPWIRNLEAAAGAIRMELLALLQEDQGFQPYVALPVNEPLGQWANLNQSPQWNAWYLWKDGARQDDHCARAPVTTAALQVIPQLKIDGFAPTAFFSVLAAGTHLPAHAGSTNVRLTVHLPLILPGPARFRVGNFERAWREGEAWVFDDTIEHEAWNDADAPRTILIFDVWNPLLTEAECDIAAALLNARRSYYQAG